MTERSEVTGQLSGQGHDDDERSEETGVTERSEVTGQLSGQGHDDDERSEETA
ncbi:hypothetical protein [Plantactinospora soyae]|uniref:Uncharacterized protein n=1 Tax=Plantactinospora soyae TaxID=1544732 RepID=A0A927LYF9_9ACTN|nr:hypothetical protein [Plantactinospora soyae]MBE1484807.1 hypothetical protein [Plantactinospora soyae]